MYLFLISLEQALILLPLILGMYLSFKILQVTDLTVDGTYVLGAVVFAKMVNFGVFFALISSLVAGAIVGGIVSYMQRSDVVNDLIVGILASFMLYSINLQILGRPNVSIIGKPTVLSILQMNNWMMLLMIIALVLIVIFIIILNSKLGLFLKAFGYNRKLLTVLGKSPEKYRFIGLITSNALAGLSGSLGAQIGGFADINMGIGIALTSISAIIIGNKLFERLKISGITGNLCSCFLGILLYFLMLNLLLVLGIEPANLKLVFGIALFLILKKMPNKIR